MIGIRTTCKQKIKVIKEYVFLKLRSKKKGAFLWFDLFLWAIIKYYTSSEREFNKDFKNLNQKCWC